MMIVYLLFAVWWCDHVQGAIRRHYISDALNEHNFQHKILGKILSRRGEYVCSGFLLGIDQNPLAGRVIMTAAHCLVGEAGWYFSGLGHTSKVEKAILNKNFSPFGPECSPNDVALALIWPPQYINHSLQLAFVSQNISDFYGNVLFNSGFGLTGRGDLSILYADGKGRITRGIIGPSKDSRFLNDHFITLSFADAYTSGLPTFGDCGGPGLVEQNGSFFLVSMVSCFVAPPVTVISFSNASFSAVGETYPIMGVTDEEIQNETFMNSLLLYLGPTLFSYGQELFSFYQGAWSYQIYLPNHMDWIVETLQHFVVGR